MNMRWTTWLIIWGAITVAGIGFTLLLRLQDAMAVADGVWYTSNVVWAGWLFFGLWHWRHILWVARIAWFVIGTVVVALFTQIALDMGWIGAVTGIIGAYCMAAVFIGGLMLIRIALSAGWRITAVARTLVDEAIRMKIAMVFIVALILMLPMLPVAMQAEEMLSYRIQMFLTWSMISTSVLLALMTIFLAVGTVSNELTQRQIFVTMTKPLGRGQYLLGKWLGIALLNLLLVAVCGGGIYIFATLLSQQEARDATDAVAVDSEVLTAREAQSPQPLNREAFQDRFNERLRQLREDDPATYGAPDEPVSDVSEAHRNEIEQEIVKQWYTLRPRESKTYVFNDLQAARELGGTVQLRLKPRPSGNVGTTVHLYLNVPIENAGDNGPQSKQGLVQLSIDTPHTLSIPTRAINDDGELRVEIANPIARPTQDRRLEALNRTSDGSPVVIDLSDEGGPQLLYTVGTFAGNLVRSLTLVWLHLCFLAVLGLAAATFLGFATASLLSLMIYIVGALSGYFQESLSQYAAFPREDVPLGEKVAAMFTRFFELIGNGDVLAALRYVIRLIGEGFMLLVPALAWFDPVPQLSDGLLVSTAMVGEGALWMGVIWGGAVGLIGWLIFRSRELARVTV